MNGNSPLQYIFDHAPGRWDDVLYNFTNAFDEALAKTGKHVLCPFCGAKGKAGFRLKRGFADHGRSYCSCKHRAGLQLLADLDGVFSDRGDMIRSVAGFLGWRSLKDTDTAKAIRKAPVISAAEREAKRLAELNTPEKVTFRLNRLKKLWNGTLDIGHPMSELGRTYLRSRGLKIPSWLKTPYVRFHPALAYYAEDGGFVGTFPAIVFLVKTPGLDHPQAVHKIYLTPEGQKIETLNPEWTTKKSSAYVVEEYAKGLHIPLFVKNDCDVVNIAEGQETAWSVALITGETSFSCIDAGKLEGFNPDPSVRLVRIWADKDISLAGQEAAIKLYRRLSAEGFNVEVMLPQFVVPDGKKGIDWLDLWALVPVSKLRELSSPERFDLFRRMAVSNGYSNASDSELENLLSA